MFELITKSGCGILFAGAFVVGGCVAPTISPIDYETGVARSQDFVSNWALSSISVKMRDGIVVNSTPDIRYPPETELVWYGDPPGDRVAQVEQLMLEAVQAGALDTLNGARPVRIEMVIDQFHAMTPRARATSLQLGVHEIRFDLQIFDADTGELLAEEMDVNSDLRALSGSVALQAEQIGQGQKIRIQTRVSEVIRGWLQTYSA